MVSLFAASSLDYSDPSEAPPQVKEWAEKRIRSSIRTQFGDGSEVILAEIVSG